ncbi:MAG: fasciclin domain-containing protein [Rhodothermales bacterium]|nr:fasciclin domain-containing protein [Rhodothermales bacterium]
MKNFLSRTTGMLTSLAFTAAGLALAGCDSDSNDDSVGTVYEVAQDNGFGTLVAAIDAAGLRPALEADGPFTVFAPTDAAFAALPAGTVESLLLPENKSTLTDILTYHVVSGRVAATQVVTLTSATTLQGQNVTIEVVDGSVFINGARVTTVDVEADNGIIHVIDAVLLPAS